MTHNRVLAALAASGLATAIGLAFPVLAVHAEDAQTGGTLRILGTEDLDHFDPTSAALVTTNNFLRAVTPAADLVRRVDRRVGAHHAARATLPPRCRSRPMTG